MTQQFDSDALAKAEHYHSLASGSLAKCQITFEVERYFDKDEAKDGIDYCMGALKLCPDNPNYLNTLALLHADGNNDYELASMILTKALKLSKDDLVIKKNYYKIQKGKGLVGKILRQFHRWGIT